jgi:uncharacterized membrane protein YqgA involved in biofilm formation
VIRCPRCSAHLLDDVVHLEDTADGLYAVVLACRCGLAIAVASTRSVTHHPGQLRLVPAPLEGAA